MICGTKTLVTNDMKGEARLTVARFSSKLKERFMQLPARHTSLEQNESVLMLEDERPIQSEKQRMTKSNLPSGLDASSAQQSCKPYPTLPHRTSRLPKLIYLTYSLLLEVRVQGSLLCSRPGCILLPSLALGSPTRSFAPLRGCSWHAHAEPSSSTFGWRLGRAFSFHGSRHTERFCTTRASRCTPGPVVQALPYFLLGHR